MQEAIRNFLYSNGINPNTRSLTDYEQAKSLLYDDAYRRYKVEYEDYIKIVLAYLGL